MLRQEQIEQLARASYALRLEEDRDKRFAFGRAHAVDDALCFPVDHRARAERIRRQLAFGDHRDILPRARELLAAHGAHLEEGSRTLAELCEFLLRAELEAVRRAVERDKGIYWGEPEDPLFRVTAAPAPTSAPRASEPATPTTVPPPPCDERPAGLGPKADEDAEAIAEAAIAEKQLSNKMAEKYRSAARAFIEVIGRKPVWRCTDDDVMLFKDTLLVTPARFTTQHKFASLAEAAAENQHRRDAHRIDPGQPKPMPTISTKTINSNYLSPLRQIFAYAAANKGTPSKINAADSVRAMSPRGERKHNRNKRLPFSDVALSTLFASPLFSGAKSGKRLCRDGTYLESSWRFWLPLAMFLMGVRPNELGQAEVCDVVYERGWPCLRVTTDTTDEQDNGDAPAKHVKTEAGERTLPIHPELIRLGFLEMVEERRKQGNARLFPDWHLGSDGTYSTTSSKVFNRENGYLDRLGLKSPRHALYSLRHNYKDTLRRSGISDSAQNLLMGHEDGSVPGIYGSRELYSGLIRSVIRLDLDGIMLSHIRPRFAVQPKTYQVGPMTVTISDNIEITDG